MAPFDAQTNCLLFFSQFPKISHNPGVGCDILFRSAIGLRADFLTRIIHHGEHGEVIDWSGLIFVVIDFLISHSAQSIGRPSSDFSTHSVPPW
jgi:hypothetical protein